MDLQEDIIMDNQSSKGISIGALVCGILGIVGTFIPYVSYFTFVLAVVGLILGAVGMKKAQELNEPKGLAVAGLVLGIIGTGFGLVGVLCTVCVCIGAGAVLGSI